jgi:hypothetical protein
MYHNMCFVPFCRYSDLASDRNRQCLFEKRTKVFVLVIYPSYIYLQISGLASKLKPGGEGEEGAAAAAEGEVQPEAVAQENGEELLAEGDPAAGAGGVSGMAQGLMMKAMFAKDAIKEKGSTFQPPNFAQLGGNMMQNVTNLIPGKKEEDVPTPPEPNPPSEIGGEMVEEQVPE